MNEEQARQLGDSGTGPTAAEQDKSMDEKEGKVI